MNENIIKQIRIFKNAAEKQFQFTKDGNWRKANTESKKMTTSYRKLKEDGIDGEKALLELTECDKSEVASIAAVYAMRFNPDKCLNVLRNISKQNIPIISSDAKQAIENWENGEWYIE